MSEILQIQTDPRPICYGCGQKGNSLYEQLSDRLFGVRGEWTMRRCPNQRCGLLWLDPMPAEHALGKLYVDYYTHEITGTDHVTLSAKITDRIRDAYCARRFGYSSKDCWQTFILRHLAFVLPGHRAQWDFSVFHLSAQPNGRLLEIGCGNGMMLKRMAGLGWQVVGIDFDNKAVEVAKSEGLDVRLGTLDAQGFSDGTFDAIVMSHVLEHVPDPRELLQSCNKILKPGGRMVSVTPNASSWGHELYEHNWRGLEPPRHLHIFTPDAMERLAEDVGFRQYEVTSSIANAHWVLWSSKQLRQHGEVDRNNYSLQSRIWGRAMQIAEWARWQVRPNSGEEVVLQAVK